MLQERDGRSVMLDIIGAALKGESTRIERRDTIRLRKKRRDEFLRRAEELLQVHGEGSTEDGVKTWRTPPINIKNDSGNVNVRLIKCVFFGKGTIEKSVGISIDVPEERFLFSIDQSCISYLPKSPLRTNIRNHFGAIATNDQVLEGLQMLEFVEENLQSNRQIKGK